MTRELPDDETTRESSEVEETRDASGTEETRDSSGTEETRDSTVTGDTDRTREPSEMSLEELREEIQSIDRDLVDLIARRTYVADTIAQVKDAEDLPTVDEHQEARVMNRAGENAERFDVDANLVKAIFRLLIELNKVHQRENR